MDKFTINQLNLYYGDFQGLRDVSLNLPANEVTAFIGPSGCGKSTLLKTLNRMNDLVEGCRIEGDVYKRQVWRKPFPLKHLIFLDCSGIRKKCFFMEMRRREMTPKSSFAGSLN